MELEQLIKDHIPWVIKLAKKLKNKTPYWQITKDDFVSAGNLALVEAANRYKEEKGPFRVFAKKRVIGEMKDEINRNCRWIHQSLDNNSYDPSLIYNDKKFDLFEIVAKELPNPERSEQILRWYFIDNLTYEQIGKRLNITTGRAYQLLTDIENQIEEKFDEFELRQLIRQL